MPVHGSSRRSRRPGAGHLARADRPDPGGDRLGPLPFPGRVHGVRPADALENRHEANRHVGQDLERQHRPDPPQRHPAEPLQVQGAVGRPPRAGPAERSGQPPSPKGLSPRYSAISSAGRPAAATCPRPRRPAGRRPPPSPRRGSSDAGSCSRGSIAAASKSRTRRNTRAGQGAGQRRRGRGHLTRAAMRASTSPGSVPAASPGRSR